MTIPLTIKGGTTRNYPEDQDRDYAAEATNWAVDVTAALNATTSSSETFRADAVVGTAAQVVAGEATHSDINTAIAAVSAGNVILILQNTYSLSALVDIDKAIMVVGQGPGTIIQSDAALVSGPIVQITATGGQLHNVAIAQGTGTPDYGVLIDAALSDVIVANVALSGTFATAAVSDGSSSTIVSSELVRAVNMTLANPLPIASGGTGQITANAALNALLPSQATASGKYLKSDGTNSSWDALDISTADITGTLPIANGGTGQVTANAAFNALAPSQAAASGKYLKSDGTNASWDQLDISTADITGTLPVANGGTGQTTANAGFNALAPSQAAASGKYLKSDGTNTAWDQIDISSADVTGTLPITSGGTGQTTANAALNALLPSQAAASGKYLKSDGTDSSWDQIDVSTADITGTLPIANGGSGQTTANAALNAFLPSQVGNSGKVLGTDATNTSWVNVASDPTTTRGDLIRRGAAALERFAAVTDNRVVRGDGTDVVSGQIDDPNFFTSGAIATDTLPGVIGYYKEDTLNTTFAWNGGGSTSSTVTLRITRVGRLVNVIIPFARATTGTGSNSFDSVTDLPSWARPLSTLGIPIEVLDGTTESIGALYISTTGNLRLLKENEAAFSNSTNCGFGQDASVTYSV